MFTTFFATIRTRLIAGALFLGGLAIAIWRIWEAGRKSERDKVERANAEAVKEAKHVTEEVNSLDRHGVDARLDGWMRDKR